MLASAASVDETQLLGWRVAHTLGQAEPACCSLDVDEASARLSGLYNTNRLRLLGSAPDFGMRLHSAQLGGLGLARLSFGTEIEIEQAGDRPFVLVTTQMRGASRVQTPWGSADGGPGFVVVDSAGQAVSKRFSGDSERCHVRVDQAALESRCAALLQQPLSAPLQFAPFSANDSALQSRWMGLLQWLLGHVGGPAKAPALLQNLEEAVLLHLLLEHEHSYSAALCQPCASLAPRHVRRAEDYIRSHAREPLTLQDIAAAVGCSVRALSHGFRQARGSTPMLFLRRIRLEGVHADLGRADASHSVSEWALHWGFSHLGRFSADYKQCFGQTPSDTLRQRRWQ